MTKLIGTVEILKVRIYPLDAESDDPHGSEVVVEPGRYELYRDGWAIFWVMRGMLDRRGIRRMGDGMFVMQASDSPSDVEVVFPSRRFGPDEWAKLLTSPEFVPGDTQRLRVHLNEDWGTP